MTNTPKSPHKLCVQAWDTCHRSQAWALSGWGSACSPWEPWTSHPSVRTDCNAPPSTQSCWWRHAWWLHSKYVSGYTTKPSFTETSVSEAPSDSSFATGGLRTRNVGNFRTCSFQLDGFARLHRWLQSQVIQRHFKNISDRGRHFPSFSNWWPHKTSTVIWQSRTIFQLDGFIQLHKWSQSQVICRFKNISDCGTHYPSFLTWQPHKTSTDIKQIYIAIQVDGFTQYYISDYRAKLSIVSKTSVTMAPCYPSVSFWWLHKTSMVLE